MAPENKQRVNNLFKVYFLYSATIKEPIKLTIV